jgi:hypothetical protein
MFAFWEKRIITQLEVRAEFWVLISISDKQSQ